MSQFQDLYAKVLSDDAFREQLVSSPSDALESIGITPTPDILASIQEVIDAVTEINADLSGETDGDVGATAFVS